jgi:hypothetical protein
VVYDTAGDLADHGPVHDAAHHPGRHDAAHVRAADHAGDHAADHAGDHPADHAAHVHAAHVHAAHVHAAHDELVFSGQHHIHRAVDRDPDTRELSHSSGPGALTTGRSG